MIEPACIRVGLIGARGYVGAELIRLLVAHPRVELALVGSRERAGQRLSAHTPQYRGELAYEELDPTALAARPMDAVLLALPNGMAAPYVQAVPADTVIIDLSADHRFDPEWHYGLPELTRAHASGRRRIANPGCYATAMQLAIAPLLELLDGPVQCFGVSGFSGAGTTPSQNNDPDALRDNLIPYALTGHLHEREVAARLGLPIEFMPHVAPHFRGLTITANLHLREPTRLADVQARYLHCYGDEALVRVSGPAPWASRLAGRHHAEVGGLTLSGDGRRVVVVCCLDNLLKGAATQALQNLNLAFGLDELAGIDAV